MSNPLLQKLKSLFSTPPQTAAPIQRPLTPLEPTTPQPVESPLTATDIGYAIGVAGGSITDAAQFQFILSRVAPNRRPTPD